MLIQKIKFWSRFFFKVKLSFRFPQKAKILLVDNEGSETVKQILNLKNCEVVYTRKECFSFPIILLLAFNFKLNIFNYYLKFIEISDPSLVITFIDNNILFYKFKKYFKNKKFISIQNGHRMAYGDIFGLLKNNKIKKNNLSADYIITFNKNIAKEYEKHINSKFIPSGSIKNNYVKIGQPKKKYNNYILFISAYRDKLTKIQNGNLTLNDYDALSFPQHHNKRYKYFLKEHIHFDLPKFLQIYCEKNKLKLAILGMSNMMQEENFYRRIIKRDFKFIKKRNFYSNYKIIDDYSLAVSTWSTLGYEALARGNKICFFSPKLSNYEKSYKFGWPYVKKKKDFFFTDKCNYLEIEKIIDKLRFMKLKTWKKKINNYQKELMLYDKNNSVLKKKISGLLNKSNSIL